MIGLDATPKPLALTPVPSPNSGRGVTRAVGMSFAAKIALKRWQENIAEKREELRLGGRH
ncbi:MAG: hypothetical protein NT023_19910 [Armatimonadetes bacterium]|nr:hypothetical protein [Armatimonadota bacterium]